MRKVLGGARVLAAAVSMLVAASANATVTYTYNGDFSLLGLTTSFSFEQDDYIQASETVSQFTSCSSVFVGRAGSCYNVAFDPATKTITFDASNASIYIIMDGSAPFSTDGTHTGSISGGLPATLTVSSSPAPELSTWALMLAGFGGVGTAMRRRKVKASFA